MSKTTPWHRGTAVEINPSMSIDEQISSASLNWNVNLIPLKYKTPAGYRNTGHFAAYRSDTNEFLDVYGPQRKPFQNREVVESFHQYCETNGLQMSHLGSLSNGKVIYAACKLPVEYNVNVRKVGDITEAYLMLKESHLQGHGTVVTLYLNRLVCTNGMTRPVLNNRVIQHVGSSHSQRVKDSLESALTELQAYSETADKLAEVPVTKQEATLHLIKAFGDPNKSLDQQPKVIQTCLRLFGGQGMGSELLSAYGTAYGLLEAVKEYYNHHAANRGGLSGTFASVAYGTKGQKQTQFERQLVGTYL